MPCRDAAGAFREALILTALQVMLSCARHSPRCCPATAGKSGSAAEHPSDSDLSAGIGGEAEPRWVTWYQPTPGKLPELN